MLLVEDNEDDVFLMKRALKSAAVTNPLYVVGDGEKAVAYLSGTGKFADRKSYPYPSLILLDLKLPYLSGLDVLAWKQLRTEVPPAVVIVITSSNEPTDLKSAYKSGASSYVVKPPTASQLNDIAKAIRLYWLTHSLLP